MRIKVKSQERYELLPDCCLVVSSEEFDLLALESRVRLNWKCMKNGGEDEGSLSVWLFEILENA